MTVSNEYECHVTEILIMYGPIISPVSDKYKLLTALRTSYVCMSVCVCMNVRGVCVCVCV